MGPFDAFGATSGLVGRGRTFTSRFCSCEEYEHASSTRGARRRASSAMRRSSKPTSLRGAWRRRRARRRSRSGRGPFHRGPTAADGAPVVALAPGRPDTLTQFTCGAHAPGRRRRSKRGGPEAVAAREPEARAAKGAFPVEPLALPLSDAQRTLGFRWLFRKCDLALHYKSAPEAHGGPEGYSQIPLQCPRK